ncbi:MAG: hypothetical protein AAF648_01440 [Pseudomonadota bacterium]
MTSSPPHARRYPHRTISRWEFWPARVFETPYYLALLMHCARLRLPPKHLAKANYALDHGEIGLGSKHRTQCAFDQHWFPATTLLKADTDTGLKQRQIENFAARHGYPLILKPDMGAVGKGLLKVTGPSTAADLAPLLSCDYLLQAYVDLPNEYGVFFVRRSGLGRITGVNRKHFPEVTGDGKRTLGNLASAHERFSNHWPLFLKDLDLERIPALGERVRLSFVGSHTMGCRFSNDPELITDTLRSEIDRFCASQPGYNFGRLDVRAASDEALMSGSFTVIEANGVASLPTHMFDPRHSVFRAWQIFIEHAGYLATAANEQRHQPMQLAPWRKILRGIQASSRSLNESHARALDRRTL